MSSYMSNVNILIITGQEGSGKTTTCRLLLSHTPNAAMIDAEDLGQNESLGNESKIRATTLGKCHRTY